ncbi:MAG: sugar fermentation stimulation protein [Rhodothalassiaceae bacterium]|nr:MAG: sugar fermentation stimulation protein [Rhodothalassiaceae bacterium]
MTKRDDPPGEDPLHRFDPPLVPGRLVRRYKRFLADVVLDDGAGAAVTAHCPNPGAMTGCAEPGMRVWLAPVKNPKAKLAWRWVLSETAEGVLVGVDTARANAFARALIARSAIPEFAGYAGVRTEVALGAGSRIDFLLEDPVGRLAPLMLEVKSVTLRRGAALAFPDAPTARGRRHLDELARLARTGEGRAAVLYLAQRADGDRFALACDIDPDYCRAARRAADAGVAFIARRLRLTPGAVHDDGPLPTRGDRAYVEA